MPDLEFGPIYPMEVFNDHRAPFDDPNWIFEIKYDGDRTVATKQGMSVNLYSSSLQNVNWRYPNLVRAIRELPNDGVYDGEVAILDEAGRANFNALRSHRPKFRMPLPIFCVFDATNLKGQNIQRKPLYERKEELRDAIPRIPGILYVDYLPELGTSVFEVVKEKNLEGLIAKLRSSPYQESITRRNIPLRHDWIKILNPEYRR